MHITSEQRSRSSCNGNNGNMGIDCGSGSTPLMFCGSALYGPRGGGAEGRRSLLGRGTAVLLDPPEEEARRRVGAYEFLFYDDGPAPAAQKLLVRWAIGPRVRLERQPVGRPGCGGPAAILVFSILGEPGCALAFDTEGELEPSSASSQCGSASWSSP